MSEIVYYTKEGLQKLKDELHRLITVERPYISQQIAEAREKGDLSENAEYDAAKNDQGMLEARIAKLEQLISNSRIIDETKLDNSKVYILSTVRLKNLKTQAEVVYTIVPENDANLKEGKISVNSPIAKGLLGRSINDKVEITVPAGKLNFQILEIKR